MPHPGTDTPAPRRAPHSLLPLPAALHRACPWLALPVLSLAAGGACAQVHATPTSPGTLATVTVQADSPPTLGEGQRLSPTDLAAQRAHTSDTASLLRDVAGASVNAAGGVSGLPALRGLADDRLRIKVDGMDLIASCPNHMNPALSYLDPSALGTLNVYAGISPVSVGGDSIGGSIVAESKVPRFAPPGTTPLQTGEVGAFYRSNNGAQGAHVSATYATERTSVRYDGSVSQADNYTAGGDFKTYDFTGRPGHTLARDEVGSTAYLTRNHALSVAVQREGHLLEARLNVQDMPYQLYPNQRMDLLGNDQQSLNLSYTGQMDWGQLQARVYHETVDHYMDFGADKRYWYSGQSNVPGDPFNGYPCAPISGGMGGCAAGMPMYTAGTTTGLTLKGDVRLQDNGVLRLGTEWQQYTLNDWWPPSGGGMFPGTFWNVNNGQRDRAALFAEWEGQLSAQWTGLVGVRVERVGTNAGEVRGYNPAGGGNQGAEAAAFNAADRQRTDHNVDLTAMARWQLDDAQTLEFGYAHKERSPNLYERYAWSSWQMAALMNNFVGDGNGYVGNLALRPEKADTLSATYAWASADRRSAFQVTPHITWVDDYIDAVPLTPAVNRFGVLRYANQSARLYGLDLSGRMPLGQNGWGQWGLQGLLSYTHGRNRDTGDGLYNVMPLNAKLTLTHQQAGWDNRVELVLVQSKTDVSRARNEISTPGYALVHLRSSYRWGNWRVDFGVENLFDRLYLLPTGGAYTGQGTTMSNPALPNYPQWGTAVPGMGRNVYLGVTKSF
ncbi:TonB-dependent receptor [Aquabacterium sp. A08]|uniref:TonB-dependent receptor n=1 Tax=Aquabacterium sp. A08 TaxID=2718532 RepID=UPI001422D96E|nr:TonB-dependent receptor [Aquabacterium sp. A08]NIC41378.1 TonB-dependent receptor [Aquabacterium sp. A08]NIC41425.1 TonB-dependent receptor [Aquabacterium sp. A08]